MLGTKIWGQMDEEILSTGGTALTAQKRMVGEEGREPGVKRESRTKGKGGSSCDS